MTASTTASLVLHRETVKAEWLDYNRHMNVAYYVLVFDHATDALCNHIGIGWDHTRTTSGSIFILESHIAYLQEVMLDDPLQFTTHVLDFDSKRIHFAHTMHHDRDGYHAATIEIMQLYVNLETRRAAAMPEATLEHLATLKTEHAILPLPPGLSRKMSLTAGKLT
ncbi:MAG TPA: thioesterase family protein [Alphaproteobacteria bacterium]|jgi:acyl-CoA thioester hydrolase|nr:thioesterase family protein [Alphaproteobacteria bacterium]